MYIIEIIPLQKVFLATHCRIFLCEKFHWVHWCTPHSNLERSDGPVNKQTSAKDMRSSIRTGNFSLKAIDSVVQEKGFPEKIITTLQEISEQTLVPLGTLLMQLFSRTCISLFPNWKHIPGPNQKLALFNHQLMIDLIIIKLLFVNH